MRRVSPVSDVARGALALAADVVAQAAVPAHTLLRTVHPEQAEGTGLGAHGPLGTTAEQALYSVST